jgi:hypothetical protein
MRATLALLTIAACAPARAPEVAARYVDENGRPLAQLDPAWDAVHDFFGDAVPPVVRVSYVARGTSRFDPDTNGISISRESLHGHPEVAIVAHETTHLALARLTKGASTSEPLRFVDEGLATIVQSRVEHEADLYRRRASIVAAQRAREDEAILAHAQRWSQYFGDPAIRADFEAYEVGASFVLFLLDTFGPDDTRRLFADLGGTRDLSRSCVRVVGRDLASIELGWRASLDSVAFEVPHLVTQSPPNEDEAVPVQTTELVVTFDVPMQEKICINAPCHEGICVDHAAWRTPTELVVRVSAPLRPGRWYEIGLGTPTCRLTSRAGARMAPAIWHFKTR